VGRAAWPPHSARPLLLPWSAWADAVYIKRQMVKLFYAPASADFGAVYDYGKSLSNLWGSDRLNGIGTAVGQGGLFDFQRSGDIFYTKYTDASNYGVGVLRGKIPCQSSADTLRCTRGKDLHRC
jgi:hypothetical protein